MPATITTEYLEVSLQDLAKVQRCDVELADPADGEILVSVDAFALTANNITYGVVGEKIGYWKFFPASKGWGILPAWGFATVAVSRHPEIAVGERLYGYFPMGRHLRMKPAGVKKDRLFDVAAHRAELPPVYNAYARTSGELHFDATLEDERMLLFPLYATSYCLYDAMQDAGYHDAVQIVILSASSKTAIGLAYAFADDDKSPPTIGLTSPSNKAKVEALKLYDSVATYDDIAAIDKSKPTLIIDMSGNGKVLSELHVHLGDNMKFTSNVGVTHYEHNSMGPHFRRDRSAMFFAPGHIQKRAKDWAPGEFEKRAYRFWHAAALKSRDWLTIERHHGMDGMESAYFQVLEGRASPDVGIIIDLGR